MGENTDQSNSEYGHFLRSVITQCIFFKKNFSRLLFLNDCLQERTLQVIGNLDDTLQTSWTFLNAFQFSVFRQHFCDTYILHIFIIARKRKTKAFKESNLNQLKILIIFKMTFKTKVAIFFVTVFCQVLFYIIIFSLSF